jgi:hypothetical protein
VGAATDDSHLTIVDGCSATLKLSPLPMSPNLRLAVIRPESRSKRASYAVLQSNAMRVESRWYPCNTLQIGRLKRMECLRVATALLFSTIPLAALAQTPEPIPVETAQTYFSEAHSLCQADHGQLWGVSLCGPIMFVDPQSRSIVASQPDAKAC